MPILRRDFMNMFGISIGSLLLARCQRNATLPPSPVIFTCYEAPPDIPTLTPSAPDPASMTARQRLQLCWLRFGDLARKSESDGPSGDAFGSQLIADHRDALDEVISGGEISRPVADLIREAYTAAVNHIVSSSIPVTCYTATPVNYSPASADNLVHQSEVLTQVAAGAPIADETMDKIRAAIEHDLAFYALTDAEVQELYRRLLTESQESHAAVPSFEELQLELTPDVQTAASFLMEILTVA